MIKNINILKSNIYLITANFEKIIWDMIPLNNLSSRTKYEKNDFLNLTSPLMTHMYKCVNNLAPPISRDTFIPRQNPHNIRNFREFCSFNNYTVKYGRETVLYRAPQLWQQLPQEIKESKTLAIFKIRIKQWKTPNCQCRLCKLYVPDFGFIDWKWEIFLDLLISLLMFYFIYYNL